MDEAEMEALLEEARQRLHAEEEQLKTAQSVRIADAQVRDIKERVAAETERWMRAILSHNEDAYRTIIGSLWFIGAILLLILWRVW